MIARSLSHLSDEELRSDLHAAVRRECTSTAELLEFLGEFDARRLFVPAAFSSMHEYCVEVLHLSEDAAKKRLQAAQVARRFPVVLAAVADGRLHLSAVVMLAARLTPENVDALVASATHRSKSQIESLLAEHFPRPDVPASIREVGSAASVPMLSEASATSSAPGHSFSPPSPARVSPLSPGRHEVRFTFSDAQREKLRFAQCLLGRAVPSGALDQVFEHVLDAFLEKAEKRSLASPARSKPRSGETDSRYVPAAIRREVMARDGRQCTFVSTSGRRCTACRRLDLDHIVPLAKGGETTAANLRLLCPVHNQHAADREFGAGFMAEKRAAARARVRAGRFTTRSATSGDKTRTSSAPGHENAIATGAEHAPDPAADRSHVDELIPWLQSLKFRKDEARRGAEYCADMREASLEDRLRVALKGLGRERFGRCTTPASTVSA